MNKKRIYMVQPNSQYGESIYFPYAAGSLIAYAFKEQSVKNSYDFVSFVYKKDDIPKIADSFKEPYLIGFSCYVWNYEFNCELAKVIRKKYPDCIIIFGGHQINRQSSVIGSDIADYVIIGEGEESFKNFLLYLDGKVEFNSVPNLLKNTDGKAVYSSCENTVIAQRESPYLAGLFDDIVESETLDFSAILETNRGCPNRCAFCDWGNIKSKIRNFPMETVLKEIDWMSDKKIEYCYCADSNFGIFERDIEIVEYFVKKHNETGFPIKFQATYSKNNPETVFKINKRLNEVGMSKGATLSFQSMSENVLENIYRKNMPISSFKKLMSLYNSNHIASYSEIIIGLPGETYNSFRDGIEQLLENGQHMAINFFNCEMLANSIMNDPEYIKKFGIETVRTEQHQYHTMPNDKYVKEYSQIVVATSTLSKPDWIKCNVLSDYVRTFHNLGLLQCFAIYLYYEQGVPYMDFYQNLMDFSKDGKLPICSEIYNWLTQRYQTVIDGDGSLTYQQDDFGDITWPLDEGAFLRIVQNFDSFYDEIIPFLKGYINDDELFNELLSYQRAVVKNPWYSSLKLNLHYDFYKFFSDIYINDYHKLEDKSNVISVASDTFDDMKTYAYKTVWYGRKGGKNIVDNISYCKD